MMMLLAPRVAAGAAEDEARYYRITTIPIPEGITLEAGGLQWMPDGRLAVSTRWGDIYLVENVLETPASHVRFLHFASGLQEPLSLAERDGWLYVIQRSELTRMKDTDGDNRADLFETVSDAWGLSGDYHEYAWTSKFDKHGDLWVALTLTGSFTSDAKFRGWCLRVTPDGRTIPTCSGLRSPGGVGTNSVGDMFFTENQGPWNGACSLKNLVPGKFMGHPIGNRWYSITDAIGPRPADPVSNSRMAIEAKRIPELIPPAVMFPYGKMGQSSSGIACDYTAGKFGPFAGQLFIGDQTHSTVMRVFLEKVNGRYQGACFMFRQGFDSGNLALELTPNGSLFVGGSDRGWGARGGKPFALQRLDWTGETPFEIHEMRACPDGFDLTFTKAVDATAAGNPASYSMEAYTYIYRADYGSPEVDQSKPVIQAATVSQDRRLVHLTVGRMVEGNIHELHLAGVRSAEGEPLLHSAAYYTLNTIPSVRGEAREPQRKP